MICGLCNRNKLKGSIQLRKAKGKIETLIGFFAVLLCEQSFLFHLDDKIKKQE